MTRRALWTFVAVTGLFWLGTWGLVQLVFTPKAEGGEVRLLDLPYRAYDRVPANADLTKFRSEDYSEKKAAGAIQVMFSETLMPSDDWLFIDGPMSPRVESVRREHCEDFYLRQFLAPHTEPLVIARLAEIPQEHPWMAEHKGKFRCYVAYLPAPASFPDTVTVVSGSIARCVPVWRSGKEPRSNPGEKAKELSP